VPDEKSLRDFISENLFYMKKLLSLCVLWLLSIFSVDGYAKGIPLFWGERESIHKIVDIPLKGSKGEDLFLAYKTHSYFLLAGIYVKDDGYVIGISGNDNGYYPLPSGYKLREFREAGMLPIELPKYKITFLDYIIGYLTFASSATSTQPIIVYFLWF
jgi:hypothetical protein